MSENEFDIQNKDSERIKRRKRKKKKKTAKRILIVIAFIVIALAVLLTVLKLTSTELPFRQLFPEKAYTFINEDVLGNTTTTTEPTTVTTTAPTTTKPVGHYLPIEEFEFEKSKKGNLLGNILQGGKAWRDSTYIYHIVDGDGIYRFYPSNETYTKIYSSPDYLSNLNITEDYLYFTNDTDKKLYALKKETKTAEPIADNVKTAYVYDNNIYYVTNSNILFVMDRGDLQSVTLYNSADDEINLIGISLGRVYFSTLDSYGTYRFWTTDNEGSEKAVFFREIINQKDFIKPVMEDGFLYYYTPNDDGTFDLQRRKFGSENVVTLIEGTAVANYAVVDMNRLFYAHRDGDTFLAKELNMNSGNKKVLLKADSVSDDNSLIFQHGGTYDFIIGYRSEDSWIYYSSCSSTSSNLVMKFKNGDWSY